MKVKLKKIQGEFNSVNEKITLFKKQRWVLTNKQNPRFQKLIETLALDKVSSQFNPKEIIISIN